VPMPRSAVRGLGLLPLTN